MGILGRIFFALAGLCFVGAVIALVGFVAGGFDVIDGGAAGAVMAYVPVALASEGQKLEVNLRGTLVKAEVVPLPFYKRAR